MKRLAGFILFAIGMILAGCGSNSANPANINGTWNAQLSGTGALSFGVALAMNNDGSLSVTNLNFKSNSPCFVSGETASGSFAVMGNFTGSAMGQFNFEVKSGSPAGNTLSLTGTGNGNTISGKWTLLGSSGCTGNGTFTMTKM